MMTLASVTRVIHDALVLFLFWLRGAFTSRSASALDAGLPCS